MTAEQPIALVGRRLFEVRPELERRRHHLATEPNIDEVGRAAHIDEQRHVAERGGHIALLMPPQNPRGERRHAKIHRFEHGPQQQIVLEAVAAAPLEQQLLLEVPQLQPHRQLHQRIEIFKRDRSRVQPMHHFERLERGRDRPRKIDSLEIGVEIGLFAHKASPPPVAGPP